MRTYLSLPICALGLLACNGDESENLEKSVVADTVVIFDNDLERLNWLLGEWENEHDGLRSSESWVSGSDSLYNGFGMTIDLESGDSLFWEDIEIRLDAQGLVYSPLAKDQNDGNRIDFTATLISDSVVVFENPLHDYPQKIQYNLMHADSLVAVVSGIENNKPVTDTFPFRRKP